mmetsp:Transcript_141798/g.453019  ORF Transcript_141798/g.453019 Transcript_141798/m.453019 type:complete len:82 (+) Transcript_141798:339-584(+)
MQGSMVPACLSLPQCLHRSEQHSEPVASTSLLHCLATGLAFEAISKWSTYSSSGKLRLHANSSEGDMCSKKMRLRNQVGSS